MKRVLKIFSSPARSAAMALGLACIISPAASHAEQWEKTDATAFYGFSKENTKFKQWHSRFSDGVITGVSEILIDCYDLPYPPTGHLCLGPATGEEIPEYFASAELQMKDLNKREGESKLPLYALYRAAHGDAVITFYKNENFEGKSISFEATSPVSDLAQYPFPDKRSQINKWTWDNRISSIKIPYGVTLNLYEHSEFGGKVIQLRGDQPSLKVYNFNNATSSFTISQPGIQ